MKRQLSHNSRCAKKLLLDIHHHPEENTQCSANVKASKNYLVLSVRAILKERVLFYLLNIELEYKLYTQ